MALKFISTPIDVTLIFFDKSALNILINAIFILIIDILTILIPFELKKFLWLTKQT